VAAEREQMPSEDEMRTVVAADLFDDLVASLEGAAQPNDALTRAAVRARRQVEC
jgi:hypothetical protein